MKHGLSKLQLLGIKLDNFGFPRGVVWQLAGTFFANRRDPDLERRGLSALERLRHNENFDRTKLDNAIRRLTVLMNKETD